MGDRVGDVRSGMRKVPFPLDKRHWHPSLLPGSLVLISTCGPDRAPNLAPKSWIQMASFDPPILLFSGTRDGTTERNIQHSGCFGVNFVHRALAPAVFQCIRWHGQERIARLGVGLQPATIIPVPLVAECRAHLECHLIETRPMGSGLIVFGEIVAASMWDQLGAGSAEQRYERLDPALFLEDGLIGTLQARSLS